MSEQILRGLPASPGLAAGVARLLDSPDAGSGRVLRADEREPRDDDPPEPSKILGEDVPCLLQRRVSRCCRATATKISRSVIGCDSIDAPPNTSRPRRSVSSAA